MKWLYDTNVSKDEGKLGPKHKLKIVHSRKSLKPFFSTTKDDSSHVKIPRIDVTILTTPFPVIPIQSIAPLPQVVNEIKELIKSSLAEIYRQKLKSKINCTIDG